MADRRIIYSGQIPLETDLLFASRGLLEGQGRLMSALIGGATVVDGLTVGPSSPTALSVVVQPGTIMAPLALDASAYGSLGADTHTMIQQGILRDSVTLTITPPPTSGQSRVYLVQVACSVVDGDATVLPYYNAANPSVAFTGPGNTGTPQNTTRAVKAVISLKAGVAAATGSQVTPTPDAGNTALAAVTVANGQSVITSGNIAVSAGVPRPDFLLPALSGAWSAIVAAAGLTPSGDAAQPLAALAALFPGLFSAGRSLATPGYMRLPGGLILQWCNNLTAASNSAGDGTIVWNFPVTFSSAIIGACFCATNLTVLTNTQRAVLGSLTTSSATVYCGGGVVSQPAGVGISGFIIGT